LLTVLDQGEKGLRDADLRKGDVFFWCAREPAHFAAATRHFLASLRFIVVVGAATVR